MSEVLPARTDNIIGLPEIDTYFYGKASELYVNT